MPTRRPRPTRCNGRQLPARAATGRNGRSRGQEGPQGNDAEARPGARRAPRVRGRAARGAGRRQDQVHHGHTTRQGLRGAPRHRHGAVQKVRQDVRGGERPAGTGLVWQELVGAVAELRLQRVQRAGVARAADSLFGCGMAKSAAIDALARVGDALEPTAKGVKETGSPAAEAGEPGVSPGGIRGRIRAVQSGPNQFVMYRGNSGSGAIDAHADGCGGCAAPGGRRPREALDPGGKRQACRARGPRGPGLAADADGAHPGPRLPRGGPSRACAEAPGPRGEGAASARLRRAMWVMPGRAGRARGIGRRAAGKVGGRDREDHEPCSRSRGIRGRSRPTTRGAPRAATRRPARQAGRSRAAPRPRGACPASWRAAWPWGRTARARPRKRQS